MVSCCHTVFTLQYGHMATCHLKINLCGVKSLFVGLGDMLKGCRCSAFVEIYCMICLFFVYVKFSCDSLDGGVKVVAA